MPSFELTELILMFGLIGATGIPAFFLKKVGTIALWAISSTFMVITLTFGFSIELITGLGVIMFLMIAITVIVDG